MVFGGMLRLRVVFIEGVPYNISRMATIATRYSFKRR
jgi:hypothetical protein